MFTVEFAKSNCWRDSMDSIHALASCPASECLEPAKSAAWLRALALAALLPARTRPQRSSSHCAPRVRLCRWLLNLAGMFGSRTPNCAMFIWLVESPLESPICGNSSASEILACDHAACSRVPAACKFGFDSRASPIA